MANSNIIRSTESAMEGHTFRIAVAIRNSTGVVSSHERVDANYFELVENVVDIRAWNLTDALRKASNIPISAWLDPDVTEYP